MNTLTTTKTRNQARKITMIDAFDVALPEATPSPFGTATLLLAALGGQMRSAQRDKRAPRRATILKILTIILIL